MQLSILLVTYLRLEKTLMCLDGIRKNTLGEFEVVLVDNGSPAEVQRKTKGLEKQFPWLTVYLLQKSDGL
ncbi:unnamed protein product, partial [marine sediment metagenome]